MAEPTDAPPTPDYRTLVYKTVDGHDLTLQLYAPAHATGPLPAIVFFFGGGWNGGSQGQFAPHCRHLVQRGMIAACADYRVNSRHGVSPDQCVVDGRDAWRYLHAHAAELGIDPSRIASGGGSAGGHVAAASALCHAICPDDRAPCRPSALVLFNPVIDCSATSGYGYPRIQHLFPAISPRHCVSAATPPPPTLLQVGDADTTTPAAGDIAFQQAAQAVGSRCDLALYPGQAHGFFNYRDGANAYYALTVARMDAFLVSLGYLPPVG